MDYNAIANALIQALQGSANANLGLLKSQRRGYFEDVNNAGAKKGTLYSTAGADQQSRYDANKYLPAVGKTQSQAQTGTLQVQGNLLDTQHKIDAMNRAASSLNAVDDNYFNGLLTG